jgi:hypothetical protein
MSGWEIVAALLVALGLLCVALKLFGLIDWPWWKALLPLAVALVGQVAAIVTAGVANYFEYIRALMDSLMGGR